MGWQLLATPCLHIVINNRYDFASFTDDFSLVVSRDYATSRQLLAAPWVGKWLQPHWLTIACSSWGNCLQSQEWLATPCLHIAISRYDFAGIADDSGLVLSGPLTIFCILRFPTPTPARTRFHDHRSLIRFSFSLNIKGYLGIPDDT